MVSVGRSHHGRVANVAVTPPPAGQAPSSPDNLRQPVTGRREHLVEKHDAPPLGHVPASIDVDLKRRLGRYRADAVGEALAGLRASYAELRDSNTRLREENEALLEEIEDLGEELERHKAREQSVS